jgi:lysophospholipase L1-like esterase
VGDYVSKWLVPIAVLLIHACGLAILASAADSAAPKPDPDPQRFKSEIAAFTAYDRENTAPKDAVVFVGSSSINMWTTAESFPEIAVINRGFGGSQASDVVHFAQKLVLKYEPRIVVFYAGDNDLAGGKTPEQVAGDFEKFAGIVHENLPKTEIIYLPVKPSLARWNIWPKMQETNALVAKFAKGQQFVTYIDTATPMLGPDSKPRPEIFLGDGLHMNAQGYTIWTNLVHDAISRPK